MAATAQDLPNTPAQWHSRVIRLAVPIVLANLTPPILSAVDTAIAGHLDDASALGGVAIGGLLFNFLFWAFGFLRMATTGLVAQAHGAGDVAALRLAVLRALLLAGAIGVVVLALRTVLIDGIVTVLGGSAAVQSAAWQYSHARIWSAPLALGNYVILGYLLGRQHVRWALVLQVVINLTNIGAVLACVYGLQLGVAGIGAATAVADTVGFVAGAAGLWWVRAREFGVIRADAAVRSAGLLAELFDFRALRRLMAMNADLFVRTVCLLASFGWFAHAGAAQGDAILAANAVLLNFQTFMSYALDGFAQAAEALVGAAIGARNRGALRSAIRVSLLWSFVGALGFAIVYALAGGAIVALLTDQANVVAAARRYLPWACVLPLASVAGYALDGVFIGATRTRELMLAMATCTTIFLLLASALAPMLGNDGLWAALTVFMAARGLTLWALVPRLERLSVSGLPAAPAA